MKYKLTQLIFALALLFVVSAAPVSAGEASDDNPPPCSECDGRDSGNWG